MELGNAYKEYNPPVTLSRVLRDIQKNERNIIKKYTGSFNTINTNVDEFINSVDKDKNLASKKIRKFLSRGASAFAFETEDNKILKLTLSNHFPMNRPIQEFDVPIYERGKIGKTFYYLEEKLFQHGLSDAFVLIVKDMIKKAGFKPYDLGDSDIHQIGMSSKGKLYLLDPECARYKTIFHALFAKAKKLLRK